MSSFSSTSSLKSSQPGCSLLHLEQQQAQNMAQGVNWKFSKSEPVGWGFPKVASGTTEFR